MSTSDGRRVFLAGATGVIGVHLVVLLTRSGFQVAGMTRSAAKVEWLASQGVVPVVCDVFDREQLMTAMREFAPEIVMHELTDLPDDISEIGSFGAATSRIRREGTRNLVEAVRAVGASRLLAQSVAWELPGEGGTAVGEHERMVLDAGGTVLRYGQFYGPGTYHETQLPTPPRVHVEQAARATVDLIDSPGGIVVVTDEGTARLE